LKKCSQVIFTEEDGKSIADVPLYDGFVVALEQVENDSTDDRIDDDQKRYDSRCQRLHGTEYSHFTRLYFSVH